MLALFFITLWAFWRYIVRRRLTATGIEGQANRLHKKELGSGSTSAGSLGREELDPGPLDDLENQGFSADFHGDFIAVRYEESTPIWQGSRSSTGSRTNREEAKTSKSSSSSSSRHRGAGDDVEGGGHMSSSPPSIDEVLQRSVRGFREAWWTKPATVHDEDREDEANADLGAIAVCPLPDVQVGACDTALCQLTASVS